jgi:hypothetical protein
MRNVYISQTEHDQLLRTSARTVASWVLHLWIEPRAPRHQTHHLGLASSELLFAAFHVYMEPSCPFSTLQSIPFELNDHVPLICPELVSYHEHTWYRAYSLNELHQSTATCVRNHSYPSILDYCTYATSLSFARSFKSRRSDSLTACRSQLR